MMSFETRLNIATFILILFYLVGLLGIVWDPAHFVRLTPINLMLSTGLLFFFYPGKDKLFYFNLFLIFTAAFILEWMGCNTGLIFGPYHYGNALGIKLASTPIIIGLNWLIVAYSSLYFADRLAKRIRMKMNAASAALMAA